jgi:hypothetical protein
MTEVIETASFRGDDEAPLVAASLACRVCLSGAADWSLRVDEIGGEVRCQCRRCGARRVLSLTPDQALRLAIEDGMPDRLA